jgi:O-antigen/teichoic acid export membrane protein
MAAADRDTSPRSRPLAESGAVLGGTAVNGVAAYLFIAVGTRTYGDAAMAPVAVLWTFWAVSVALFMFPIQHWTIRKIAADGHSRGVGAALPRVALVVGLGAAVLAGGAWLGGERLFGSSAVGWPILVLLVTVGSAFSGLQRGVLAGGRRFFAAAANIAGENLLRLGAGLAVAASTDSVLMFAAMLAVGPLVAVFWPEALRLEFGSAAREPVFGFLGGLAGGILVSQVILNAGPVVLQGLGGAEEDVTALFLSLALFRAPYLLALGAATRLTGPLTDLVVGGRTSRLNRVVRWVVMGTLGAAAVAAAGAYLVGPWLVDAIFAPSVPTRGPVVAAIALGSTVALGGLGLVLVLLAQHRTAAIQATWLGGLGGALAGLAAWPGDDLARVVASFIAGVSVAFIAMVAVLRGWSRTAPGSRH